MMFNSRRVTPLSVAQIPSMEDDRFEIVEYTSTSYWDRFVTMVEEVLRAWEVSDGSFGIFDDSKLHLLRERDFKVVDPYIRKETIILDDNSYTLSYHCHPGSKWLDENTASRESSEDTSVNQPLKTPEFLPLSLPTCSSGEQIEFHNLHRWTGWRRLLVITPTTRSDIYNTGSIDRSTTERVLKSFVIAFKNIKCNLPVFAPTGQISNSLYEGHLCLFPQDGQFMKFRFHMLQVRDVQPAHTHLSGLTSLFLEKLKLHQRWREERENENESTISKLKINVSALFTYELVNLDDDDWRRLGEECDTISSRSNAAFDEDLFLDGFEQADVASYATRNIDYQETSQSAGYKRTTACQSKLPFGPVKDPLISLTLTVLFPSAPHEAYTDDDVYTEMDAVGAPIWSLTCKFATEETPYAQLASILQEAIQSWLRDISNTISANTPIYHRLPRPDFVRTKSFAEQQELQGSVALTIVDMVDIDNVMHALFDPYRNGGLAPETATEPTILPNGITFMNATALDLNFRHGTIVPAMSLLWNLLEYLLESVSPATNSQSSLMGSLKIIWNEMLKRIRQCWERRETVPNVDIYRMLDNRERNYARDGFANNGLSKSSTEHNDRKRIGIDLRFNIVHQKLCMINCCIERLRKLQRDGTPLSTSPHSLRRRIPSSSSLNSSFTNILKPKIPQPSPSGSIPRQFESENVDAVLINSFNSISTDDLPSIDPSSSVILVGNNSDIFSTSASVTSSPSSAVFPVPSRMDKYVNPTQSPTINDLIFVEKEMINDEVTGTLDYQNSRSAAAAQPQLMNGSSVIGNAFSPTPSEYSDPNQSSLLTDSFVQLSYSSSSESISGFDCGYGSSSKPGSNESISINGSSGEVIDEHVREGHLYMLAGIRLQKTGEPVWVPETQDAGLLTEDMVREQEEFLANLGCSESASRKRAEIQSSCLKSDMEAFKAANPQATLEDFVRWHSPRDWIPDEGDDPDKGCLSPRMLKEGNFWQNLWERARRVPVSRQKPLFDYLVEGEKALKYLEDILIDDLFVQLLPTMFLIAYDTLASHSIACEIKPVTLGLAELAQALT
ncbi:3800_t:CDS:2, partial [Paraglomus occultum]